HAGYVAAWLLAPDGKPSVRGGNTSVLADDDVSALDGALRAAVMQFCSIHDAPGTNAVEFLARSGGTFAVRLDHPEVKGIVLVGPISWYRHLGEEEQSFLLLLVEQLASTIHNGRLQAERQEAERRALQSEKLATLGLVAGSLAHEIRNPLSSI